MFNTNNTLRNDAAHTNRTRHLTLSLAELMQVKTLELLDDASQEANGIAKAANERLSDLDAMFVTIER